ncbi:MAG: beta-ketoacyl-ACP synthase II [Syntrophaceae bacterium]|nr:beta-ketoacyl-ACP synthase II [Syntrophaceae bacterium]
MNRRVVVTGIGVVSPIGIGKNAFWHSLINGRSGIGPITHFDASSYPCKIAAEVHDFHATDFIDAKSASRMARGSAFAIASIRSAFEDSKLDLSNEDPYQLGLSYGTALGPMDIYEKFGATFYERGLKHVSPIFLGMMNHNAMIGAISEAFNIRGYNTAISAGCSSGNVAIANAYYVIARGGADILATGGVDTPIYPLTFGLYSASQSLARHNGNPQEAMCPYDKRRSGFVLGEGAGALILEERERAIKRQARIYAEVLGCGLTNDANNLAISSPETRDSIKAFQIALTKASLSPDDVDYVCGHAHSSVMMDKKETLIIKKVFGEHAFRLAVSSIKAMIGHSMGGGTALQSIAAILALHEGILPPTINYQTPDPECDLDYVPNHPRKKNINVAIANSFVLGGTNVVIVYGNPKKPNLYPPSSPAERSDRGPT